MDVLIRGVEPYTLKKINEMAKKRGISQQVFLKNYLEQIHLYDFVANELNQKYINVIDDLKNIIEENNNLMNELKDLYL